MIMKTPTLIQIVLSDESQTKFEEGPLIELQFLHSWDFVVSVDYFIKIK